MIRWLISFHRIWCWHKFFNGDCKEYVSKALFVVGEFGVNDYHAAIFSGISLDEVRTYVPQVVKAIGKDINKLIRSGAMNRVVPGVLPIGCFPLYLTLYNSSSKSDYNSRTGCLRKFNSLAFDHNMLLKRYLVKIQEKHPNTRIMYDDFYTPVMDFVIQPTKFVVCFRYLLKAAGGNRGP